MDMAGLDVVRDVETVYYRESGDASDGPPQLLLDKIARGELGVKTGKGFYRYPHPALRRKRWLPAWAPRKARFRASNRPACMRRRLPR